MISAARRRHTGASSMRIPVSGGCYPDESLFLLCDTGSAHGIFPFAFLTITDKLDVLPLEYQPSGVCNAIVNLSVRKD